MKQLVLVKVRLGSCFCWSELDRENEEDGRVVDDGSPQLLLHSYKLFINQVQSDVVTCSLYLF